MIRETFIFYALLLYVCFLFLHWVKFVVVVLNRFFFSIVRQKKVVAGRVKQVVVLHSNDCMEICMGGFSIGRLDEWSSYRGACLNRFHSIG